MRYIEKIIVPHLKQWCWVFLFSFFQGRTCGIWKFPGQGSSWIFSASLRHSHSNSGSEPTVDLCDLHHSSQQHQILNPFREARDGTRILMDTSWLLNPLIHNKNSSVRASDFISDLYDLMFFIIKKIYKCLQNHNIKIYF